MRVLALWNRTILRSVAACACVALIVIGWLRPRRSGHSRPPGCTASLQQRYNETVSADILSDPLFTRLCTAPTVHDARGGCFEVDGSRVCLPGCDRNGVGGHRVALQRTSREDYDTRAAGVKRERPERPTHKL